MDVLKNAPTGTLVHLCAVGLMIASGDGFVRIESPVHKPEASEVLLIDLRRKVGRRDSIRILSGESVDVCGAPKAGRLIKTSPVTIESSPLNNSLSDTKSPKQTIVKGLGNNSIDSLPSPRI